MPIKLTSGTYTLDDDEAMNFLNAATGTTFVGTDFEIETVDVVSDENGERTLVVVVGPKG
jgi:hypothetical protein